MPLHWNETRNPETCHVEPPRMREIQSEMKSLNKLAKLVNKDYLRVLPPTYLNSSFVSPLKRYRHLIVAKSSNNNDVNTIQNLSPQAIFSDSDEMDGTHGCSYS